MKKIVTVEDGTVTGGFGSAIQAIADAVRNMMKDKVTVSLLK